MPLELTSFGEDAPSGANLEYEQVFTDMTLAAQPGEERQVGDEIIPGQEPDPRKVIEAAEAVLARSHDLRAAVLLAWGRLRIEGLSGFAEVTNWIRRALEEQWSSVHPQLDEDDDDDPTMRVNAVRDLTGTTTVLRALRGAPLARSRAFGAITLRDIEISEGEIEPREGDRRMDPAAISAALRDAPDEDVQAVAEAARSAREDLRAIDAIFAERTPGQGPPLEDAMRLLARIASRIAAETGTGDAGGVTGDDTQEEAAAPAAGPSAGRTGDIASPRDVEQAIDRIVAYYRKAEPSSPVPILLGRAKRLVGADFLTIVKNIAPDGVDQVRRVGGLSDDDD